mgnify:CR=1 FL=1
MKFYNREEELCLLDETRKQSFESHSLFTVVTGRRRVGKTKLILRSCEGTPTVYLFVARKNEGDLCERFAQYFINYCKDNEKDKQQIYEAIDLLIDRTKPAKIGFKIEN